MVDNFNIIQDLLRNKAELQSRLNLIPYEGTIEIKEVDNKKYLYIRKRIANKVKSTYVGIYSIELHSMLLKQVKDAKEIKKSIRTIEKELAKLGYSQENLSNEIILNLDFARANMKSLIYDQAILEGISTTFPDTEAVIDNGKVNNMSTEDVMKIINLKHAWEFILDGDVIQASSDYYLLCHIAKLVNEGFFSNGGRIRSIPVNIGGSTYKPPIPIESIVKEKIDEILKSDKEYIDVAIELCMYCMKTQIFIDGNKRASVIFANHYLIAHGQGFLVIPEEHVPEFKKKLVDYYEGTELKEISDFLKKKCWKNF